MLNVWYSNIENSIKMMKMVANHCNLLIVSDLLYADRSMDVPPENR
jgi:hypothetical protein